MISGQLSFALSLSKGVLGVLQEAHPIETLGDDTLEDYEGKRASAHYLRTREKKEVAFAVAVADQLPTIETKLSEIDLAPSLRYFHEKYDFSAAQVVLHLRKERMAGNIPIRRVLNFLRGLKM